MQVLIDCFILEPVFELNLYFFREEAQPSTGLVGKKYVDIFQQFGDVELINKLPSGYKLNIAGYGLHVVPCDENSHFGHFPIIDLVEQSFGTVRVHLHLVEAANSFVFDVVLNVLEFLQQKHVPLHQTIF